jgi:hypothetical protein
MGWIKDFYDIASTKPRLWAAAIKFFRAANVSLTPTSGPSDKMLLAVKNLGEDASFNVQCEIVNRRNDPNLLHRKTFDVKWEHSDSRETRLRHAESRNLLVALAVDDRQHELEYMRVCELLGNNLAVAEQSRWDREQRDNLPEYDLKFTVFSDNTRKPFIAAFTLKAGRRVALEMVPV